MPDPTCGLSRVLVFPHPDRGPAGVCESAIRVPVPFFVPVDLRGPESGIGHRDGVVIGAAVPEAPVQEDGDLGFGEHEIRSPSHLL